MLKHALEEYQTGGTRDAASEANREAELLNFIKIQNWIIKPEQLQQRGGA